MERLIFKSEKYGEFTAYLYVNTSFQAKEFQYHSKADVIQKDMEAIKNATEIRLSNGMEQVTVINRKPYKGLQISIRLNHGGDPLVWFTAREYGVYLTDAARQTLEKDLTEPIRQWVKDNRDRLIVDALQQYKTDARQSLKAVIENAQVTLQSLRNHKGISHV